MYRKFFNADAAEVAAAPEVAEANPLAALATSGRFNITGETTDDVPEYKPQDTTTANDTAAPPADTANDAVIDLGLGEFAMPTEQPRVEQVQEAATQQQAAISWQDVIKKEQPESVLKELGFDEKVIGFLNHWKGGGDVKTYLQEMATDYGTMPAEEVMKHQLRLEYPKLSEKHLEVLYQDEVVDKYKLDPEIYSEEEVERGKLLLEARAEKYRAKLVENQQKFLLPPAPERSNEVDPVLQEQQRLIEDGKKSVYESPMYRQVLSTNKITIGQGEDAFNFPVNAQELIDVIYDPEQFVSNMFNVTESNGKIDIKADPEKQVLVAAVAKHGKQFFVEMAKHYMALGGRKAIRPIENPSMPNSGQPAKSEAQDLSPAAILARQGRVVG